MKILITGGGGFLGSAMVLPIEAAGHEIRLMEPRPCESRFPVVLGDVTKLADVEQALEGMDAVIVAHMAPRSPNAYETPELCFSINVTGTANVLHAANAQGIKRAVIISTTGPGKPTDAFEWINTRPLQARSLYGLTKECQETIGMHYAREFGMSISILRIGYVLDGDKMEDKYGRTIGERAPLDCDRRDVGEVARLALERDDIDLEVFPVMSTREAHQEWGTQHTIDRLGWQPRYDFDRLPMPKAKA